MSKPSQTVHRSKCPLASSLDLFGDKWTLLVVRDLMYFGECSFKDLQNSAENIPTNTLSERLKRLENLEVISKTPYQTRPVRYQYTLTKKGLGLLPALKAITLWGQENIDSTIEIVSNINGVETLTRPVSVDVSLL